MVRTNAKKIQTPELIIEDIINLPEEELRWSTIKLSEVLEKNIRFEASVFDIEAKHAREVLNKCKYSIVNLLGEEGFIDEAFYPGRFKRIYVEDKTFGEAFYMPSQINELYPKPNKFISTKTKVNIEKLKVEENTILLTRSGTIGDCTYVSKTIKGYVFSDDVIRIKAKEAGNTGYLYAFIKTKIGQTLIKTNNYGAVVSHIEPEHLKNILIPDPPAILKQQIHNLVVKSYKLRDESNDLIDEAEKLLVEELKLPPIEDFAPSYFDTQSETRNYNVKLSNLNLRFDGSFHVPVVDSIVQHISNTSKEVKTIGNPEISKEIILPGRFKRVYVEEGQGTVFFGGKQLYELDPTNKKFLSLLHHGERIKEELYLKENMIMITCSGTIAKVNIVPKHWENWTANQHILRVMPANKDIAGYIYTWLSSDYGYELIKRYTYGAVVDEITDKHMADVQIPLLKNKEIQKQINDKVLEANKKRYEAYIAEQKAIKMVNDLVIHAEK